MEVKPSRPVITTLFWLNAQWMMSMISAFISATYDSHMLIIGIEHQIAGLGLIPRDGGTVGVLHVGTAAVAYDVLSISNIVKYPIDKSTAI